MSAPDYSVVKPERRGSGPLRVIINKQDSLYYYISWENPVRSLGTYLGALGILCGAHYIPLTQIALKAAATTLGVISVVEFASRSFGPNTPLVRLRPKQYKKVSEATLNATLNDIHDFVQYIAVEAQKIIWVESLENTFAVFVALTGLFCLTLMIPPFWLAVLFLTSLYLAPLVISPVGRELDIRRGKIPSPAKNGVVKTPELSSKAPGTTS